MEIEFDDKLVEEAGRHFDDVANCIINRDFAIKEMPDKTRYARNATLSIIAESEEGGNYEDKRTDNQGT